MEAVNLGRLEVHSIIRSQASNLVGREWGIWLSLAGPKLEVEVGN